MDDISNHDLEGQDIDDELDTEEADEGEHTPADTDGGEPKTPAEKAKEDQKRKWLADIKSGKRTLEDMPKNLGWLRKEIEPELGGSGDNELDRRVQEALKKEREKEDLSLLIDDIEENASEEQLAQFKEEYDSLIADGATPLRATITARRLVGLHDSKTMLAERRRRGMLLPPHGSRKRDTAQVNKMTEIEKKLSGGLPPGFGG